MISAENLLNLMKEFCTVAIFWNKLTMAGERKTACFKDTKDWLAVLRVLML